MKTESTIETIEEVVDEIVSELEDLASGCESQRDNMPENLQSSPVYDELRDMADALEGVRADLESFTCVLHENKFAGDEKGNNQTIAEIPVKTPRFVRGSRNRRIGRLIEIIRSVATAVTPKDQSTAKEISEFARTLENI